MPPSLGRCHLQTLSLPPCSWPDPGFVLFPRLSLDAQKVYVGNLNRATTKEALGAFFGPTATEVEIARIRK